LPVPRIRQQAAGFEGYNAMSPLVTALICFGAFVLIGLIAKIAVGMWMKRQ
jgi:hypothetical protein